MAKKKLTLSVEEEVIRRAKAHADEHGTSISRLVGDFLARLTRREPPSTSPAVERLVGILPPDASLEDHRRHLEEKYGR